MTISDSTNDLFLVLLDCPETTGDDFLIVSDSAGLWMSNFKLSAWGMTNCEPEFLSGVSKQVTGSEVLRENVSIFEDSCFACAERPVVGFTGSRETVVGYLAELRNSITVNFICKTNENHGLPAFRYLVVSLNNRKDVNSGGSYTFLDDNLDGYFDCFVVSDNKHMIKWKADKSACGRWVEKESKREGIRMTSATCYAKRGQDAHCVISTNITPKTIGGIGVTH